MREDLTREADGDALGTLGEEEGELYGEGLGLFVAAVVGSEPVGGLGVEDHIEGELREAGFDVAGGGSRVAGVGVPPVPLHVDEQLLLPELDHGIGDRGITVRVVFHGVADDVGDLVIAAVFELAHGVEDAALDGLEPVVGMGDGPFEDDVAGVVEEPLAEHLIEVAGVGLQLEKVFVRNGGRLALSRGLVEFKFGLIFFGGLFAWHVRFSGAGSSKRDEQGKFTGAVQEEFI